jgi:hypothetical protein
MRKVLLALLATLGAGSVAGCGLVSDAQTVAREVGRRAAPSPDDDVATGAPLAVPPDSGLRPPVAGPGSGASETAGRARVVLKDTPPPGAPGANPTNRGQRSAGEVEVLAKAGGDRETSDVVRRTLDVESERRTGGERGFAERILKYDGSGKPDPKAAEAARDGTGEPPVIRRKGEF